MKPQKLTVSAWGPYPGEIQIDFQKVGEGGLFLITGPTGSGKTTLFDAISYALYGEVSGSIREENSVRCSFAKPENETFVELEFTHQGKTYHIRRTPRYLRPKKKGNGEVEQKAQAQFWIEGKKVSGTFSEIDESLREILGMDHRQFKQVSMIAQGEFMDLLTADSKKRGEILTRIFRTDLYRRMQEILSAKTKSLEQENRELERLMREAAAGIVAEGNLELEEALRTEAVSYEKIVHLLEEDSRCCKKEQRNLEQQIQDLDEQQKSLTEIESLQDQIRRKQEQQDENARKEEKLDQRYEQIRKESGSPEDINQEIEELSTKVSQCQDRIRWCEDLEKKSKTYQTLCEQKEDLEKQRQQQEKKIAECEQDVTAYEETLKNFEDLQQTKLQAQQQVECKEEELKQVQDFQKDCSKALSQKEKYRESQDSFLEVESDYEASHAQWQEEAAKRRRSAAGLLAENLQEGEVCPVCGSLHHPHLALLETDVLSEAQLDRLEKESKKLEKKARKASEEAAYQKAQYESLEGQLREIFLDRMQKESEPSIQDVKQKESDHPLPANTLQFLHSGCGEEKPISPTLEGMEKESNFWLAKKEAALAEAQEELAACGCRQKERDRLVAKLEETREKRDTLSESRKAEAEQYQDLLVRVGEAGGAFKEARNRFQSESLTTEEISKQSLLQQKEALDKELDQKKRDRKELDELQKQRASLKVLLEEGQKEMSELKEKQMQKEEQLSSKQKEKSSYKQSFNSQDVSFQAEQSTCTQLMTSQMVQHQKEKLQQKKEDCQVRFKCNEQARQSLEGKLKKRSALSKQYGDILDLDQAARGKNEKNTTFERYVQGVYFDEVLKAANLRLKKMSGERYQMFRVNQVADKRTTNSLDIDVVDFYTDANRRRSVRTLSGGEAFLAALSLALGLSDIIESSNGGIEIEALFIDEGFGTLDEDSLQNAIDTLLSVKTKNQMIGIISHRQELKDRIPKQIVIEKHPEGSSVRVVGV